MIRVGTNSFGYNQQRNYVSLPFQNVCFKKVNDFKKVINYINYKLFGRINYKQINRFNDYGLSNVDLYHFFNTITPIRKPWIVTYEHTLPRADPDFCKGYDWMSSEYCKKIIAFSQRAYYAQITQLSKRPSYKDSIESKMVVLHPTQRLLIDKIDDKIDDKLITITFVGSAFYRKGGWELIQAFERLKKMSLRIKLIVISKLEKDGYKDKHITDEMQLQTRDILSSNPLIEYYPYLPNERVLYILKRSHVGILPSWGETYGYFILEAMASGCAVIVPNVSPFPEFVSSEWGWLIDVNTSIKNGIEISDPTEENTERMISGIINAVYDILDDREGLNIKCKKAINRISENHNPDKAALFLESIYNNSI